MNWGSYFFNCHFATFTIETFSLSSGNLMNGLRVLVTSFRAKSHRKTCLSVNKITATRIKDSSFEALLGESGQTIINLFYGPCRDSDHCCCALHSLFSCSFGRSLKWSGLKFVYILSRLMQKAAICNRLILRKQMRSF